jgi:hypothetical protein
MMRLVWLACDSIQIASSLLCGAVGGTGIVDSGTLSQSAIYLAVCILGFEVVAWRRGWLR